MPGTDAHTTTPTSTGAPAAARECYADPDPADPAPEATPAPQAPATPAAPADCLHCGRPTEYPADRPGIVLCPVCEWQEAQRSACSG